MFIVCKTETKHDIYLVQIVKYILHLISHYTPHPYTPHLNPTSTHQQRYIETQRKYELLSRTFEENRKKANENEK